ncbi:MAG TPA: TIR domain-containing protein, partial [Opitutaceae bacterium]
MSVAVFLSYASEDADAARRLSQALTAAGVEVWFDQSELRGGDAWDQKIRRQIKECTLFVPVISSSTQARSEGYFRREWRMAVERTQDMADHVSFLLPVVLDDIADRDAHVPEAFREVQWTRMQSNSEPDPRFAETVRGLLHGANPSRGPHPGNAHQDHPPGRPDGTQKTADPKSVAVLAFANRSEDKENEYFSDGISEELINALTKVAGLKVSARTSAFHFKAKDLPISEIARQLGVSYVVEGSVRKVGDRVRITAQLIKAADGFHVWSDTFTRDLKDIFAVQDEIAGLIATNLALKLGTSAKAIVVNPEAFQLFLKGREIYRRSSVGGVSDAIALLKASLAIDQSAVTWALLSMAEI